MKKKVKEQADRLAISGGEAEIEEMREKIKEMCDKR